MFFLGPDNQGQHKRKKTRKIVISAKIARDKGYITDETHSRMEVGTFHYP